jgi:hypothetical protein
MLPRDFLDWQTARNYFDAWRRDGTWEKIHDALRAKVRKKAGQELSVLAWPIRYRVLRRERYYLEEASDDRAHFTTQARGIGS